MSDRYKKLTRKGQELFSNARPVRDLWQEIALNFFPERADFTHNMITGKDLASHLATGMPALARRSLSNIFSMQRPQDKEWFRQRLKFDVDMNNVDQAGLEFLDFANQRMYRAMYDKNSGFTRAVKEGDDDYATFGQCVISIEFSLKYNNLLYRTHHLRDVVWEDDVNGRVSSVWCRRKFSKTEMQKLFKKVSPNLEGRECKGEKYEVFHIVVPAEDYYEDGKQSSKLPYVSLYVDVAHMFLLDERPSRTRKYVIPRWVTVSGSQYAYSPATTIAISDSRMLQEMYDTLVNAGEMAVNPAVIGVEEAFRSDLEYYPGGFTAVDAAYDERLGDVLRPIVTSQNAIPYGVEMQRDVEMRIREAFYLDKIGLPQLNKEMTAFETSQRVAEYVREATPLFQPYEMEYNGELCEMTFDTLMHAGGFGSMRDIPESIRGKETSFVFESALQGAREQQKSQKFLETKAIIAEGALLDQGIVDMFKVDEAVRDVLSTGGTPAKWMNSKEDVAEKQEQKANEQAQQQAMASLQQGGVAAEQIGKGAQAMRQSGLL